MNPSSSNTITMKNPISTLIQPFLNRNTINIVTPMICPMMMAALVNELAMDEPLLVDPSELEDVVEGAKLT